MPGPLTGKRIIELAGIGPGPFAAMMLGDQGADVVRIDRVDRSNRRSSASGDPTMRNRRRIAVDLKHPDGVEVVLRLVEGADALIEGFRPGVTERLGLGPDVCLARNPRLVYGRMTGWGQDGPLAQSAGHDLNYIALAGVAAHIGRAGQPPTPPLNLVGDYGGGAMFLAYGVVCALLEASTSGRGQVVDAAVVDGSAALMAPFWTDDPSDFDLAERGTNLLDSGAHFYDVYQCADGEYVSVGSIERKFYEELIRRMGLRDDPAFAGNRFDRESWTDLKNTLRQVFASRTRAEWCAVLEGTDACFAPVLSMREAAQHPHNVARRTFIDVDGRAQPAPAPRFSRTPGGIDRSPSQPGADTWEVLRDYGLNTGEIEELLRTGAIDQPEDVQR